MAKLNDTGLRKKNGQDDPQTLLWALKSFVATCKRPAVLDYGDAPIPLLPNLHNLEIRAGKVTIEAWDESRNLARCIISIDRRQTGILDCTVQRFGGATGALAVLDLDRPQVLARVTKGARQSFAEQFRRMLRRQFPAWEINTLSSSMDLRRSFSTVFPRAHVQRGSSHVAALACALPDNEPELLCSALLWYDHLRRSLPDAETISLALFLPETGGNLTSHRLRWLSLPSTRLFRFNEHGMSGEVDARDLGNFETRLTSRYTSFSLAPELRDLLARLAERNEIGCCPEVAGALSIRFRGLEFARLEDGKILLGIEDKQEVPASAWGKVELFADQLASLSGIPKSAGSALPIYPERWFESVVRSHLQVLDPELMSEPVHGQVLSFAAGARELIDLLALTHARRLVILELKTSEDMQLPMQALDYWMRIRWHAEREELGGLFPGRELLKTAPKLLLVAPALSFHPSNEILLRYFSPEIEVERIGVNSDWESTLRVAFRLRGADGPISHARGPNDTRWNDQH